MANGISRETYTGMDADSKLNVLFDLQQENHACSCETRDRLEILENKYDRRKRFDTAVSGASGFVGGALMVFIKWIMGGKP